MLKMLEKPPPLNICVETNNVSNEYSIRKNQRVIQDTVTYGQLQGTYHLFTSALGIEHGLVRADLGRAHGGDERA